MAEVDGEGGTVRSRFIRAGDRLLAERSATTSYAHPNHQGTLGVFTDAAGSIASRRQFTAWGEETSSEGPLNRYRFGGEWTVSSGDLVYLRARWFRPSLGRLLSADPEPGLTWLPASRARYSYAGSSPTVLVDPTGRSFVGQFTAVAIAGVLAGLATTCFGCEGSLGPINSPEIAYRVENPPGPVSTWALRKEVEGALRRIYEPLGFRVVEGEAFGARKILLRGGPGAGSCDREAGQAPIGGFQGVVKLNNVAGCVDEYAPAAPHALGLREAQFDGFAALAAAHEVGHMLGLSHRDTSRNLMADGSVFLSAAQADGFLWTASGIEGAGFFTLDSADASKLER